MNIILTGFMGTGKTVVAKALAKELGAGWKYIDLDDRIEKKDGRSINQIFAEDGEKFFRSLEKDAARDMSKLDSYVTSTGGGVVLLKENMDNFRKNGTIICLTAAPEVIYSRVKNQAHRPLLKVDDPLARIKKLLDDRKIYYQNADFTIDTSTLTVEQVTKRIINYLKERKYA